MTTKHWGDEPAQPYTGMVYDVSGKQFPDPDPEKQYKGFTKLERACIDLKVPHPDLPPELRALILESRRLDYAGDIMHAVMARGDSFQAKAFFEISNEMISELEKK